MFANNGGMNLKAVTLASLTALALAGAACSETPADTKTQPPAPAPEATPASAPANDGFNLRVPGDPQTGAPGNDGFNLRIPGDDPSRTAPNDGFNLPSDVPTTRGLTAVPEFNTSPLPPVEDTEAVPEEDEIIRLDP